MGRGGWSCLPYRNDKFVKGDHVTSESEGHKDLHRVHLAHPLLGLTRSMPAHSSKKNFHRPLPPNKS